MCDRLRTLIIGLDGADLAVMQPWIKKGRLPNVAGLIREGVSCPLRSTWPPNTSPAWPALVTGMSPGNLGLFDFIRPEGYGKRIISRQEIQHPALWDILTTAGKGVVVVGVPMTYPPPVVRGAMVAGFLSPTGRNNGQPLDLLDRFPELRATSRFSQSEDDLVRRPKEICDGTLRLLEAFEWDLAMVVFNATDWAMHFHWGKPRIVRHVFETVDAQVGRLIDRTSPDNVVIVSDHGFGPVSHLVNVNGVLEQTGFLAAGEELSRMYPMARDLRDERGQAACAPRKPSRLAPFWLRLRRWVLSRLSGSIEDIGRFSGYFSPKFVESKGSPLAALGRFDWEKTKAYLCSPGAMTVNVNLKGREPKGTVSKDDFERARDDVIAALSEWKAPGTGRRVFRRVFRPEEFYTGKRVGMAPDLFFELEPGYHAVALGFGRSVWKVRGVGQHAPCGVFIGHGSMFNGGSVEEMSIVDVLPTLLEGMSVPLPADLDGRVVGEILS